jgi:hypothetical protein
MTLLGRSDSAETFPLGPVESSIAIAPELRTDDAEEAGYAGPKAAIFEVWLAKSRLSRRSENDTLFVRFVRSQSRPCETLPLVLCC